ncbi:MAG: polysaccharide deacetylase family protein [Chloroflexota bacterium]
MPVVINPARRQSSTKGSIQSGAIQDDLTTEPYTLTVTTSNEITADTGALPNQSTALPQETESPLPQSTLRLKDLLNQPITITLNASLENALGATIPPLPKPLSPSLGLPTISNLALPDPEENFSASAPIRVERTVQVPILMYHYLSVPPADADIYRLDLSVRPDQFASHLDAMQEAGYTTISLYELWNHLVNGAVLPPKPVVLTFDDGYRDNYENAFPLLVEREMTATFFVVTDFINHSSPRYVSWEMVREMHDAGMSIESHGINHYSLKNRDTEFLVFQALRTKETIEEQIGVAPRFVSYPAGEYDGNTVAVFESANYLAGVTTIQGAVHNSKNLFELHRVRVRGTTDSTELLRLLALEW